jgi:hypothetical protein
MELIGGNRPMSYMFILQNNNEIRPTGGFMGSLAIVNAKDGDIEINYKDIYDYDGQFKKFIEAPDVLRRITPNFSLRDANFYPDFKVSSKQIGWFFENSGGYSLDFIFALNPTILQDLLEVTGPIALPAYGVTFDKNNYLTYLMLLIESKAVQNYPKQVMFDLGKEILNKLSQEKDATTFLAILDKLIKQKDLQAYSFLPQYQQLIEKYALDGKMLYTDSKNMDYLNIVAASVGGNKSDRYINNDIQVKTLVAKEGSIFNTVKYTRAHTWDDMEEGKITKVMNQLQVPSSPALMSILGKGRNIAYIRIYMPLGASVLSTNIEPENYRIINELGYTVFATVMETDIGGSTNLEVSYTIPYKLFNSGNIDTYHYYYQKQGGLQNITFNKEIQLPDNITLVGNENLIKNITTVVTDIAGEVGVKK